jgi:hypothetical protein
MFQETGSALGAGVGNIHGFAQNRIPRSIPDPYLQSRTFNFEEYNTVAPVLLRKCGVEKPVHNSFRKVFC